MAPTVIRRPRLEDWFARFKSVPVRFLVGPPGSGKTTAAVSYLVHSKTPGFYVSVPKGATGGVVSMGIARAMGLKVAKDLHGAVIRALTEAAPAELAIDGADLASADGIHEINRLIEELPNGVSLLIASRSRTAIDVAALVTRGIATLCDAERLAFDIAEIRHLAETCDVSAAHTDLVRLHEATDGWAMAVSGAIRRAAEDGRSLAGAFEHWCTHQGHLFSEFVSAAIEDAPPEKASLVRQLQSGVPCTDQNLLRSLEAEGLFVIHGSGEYRPLRALSRLHSHARPTSEARNVRPMHIRMLGRFQAEIDGTPIEWIRRRDAQIFQYVALKRNGTASRAELAETFWPGAEKHLVAQSLRTAFSNIRKAIGTIVGFDLIDAYVHANGDLSLNLGNVIVDVNRFVAHANDGDIQYARDELRAAFAHYRSADYAYWGDLLISDAAQPRFAAQAAMLSDRHLLILERLTEITRELNNYGAAVHYARRVVELRPGNAAAQEALTESMRLARLHRIAVVTPAPEATPSSVSATTFA